MIAYKETSNLFNVILAWFGFSILMHAFPSTGDAKVMVDRILKNEKVGIIPKILFVPFILLVYIGAAGSFFWLDAVFAAAVALAIPNIIVHFF